MQFSYLFQASAYLTIGALLLSCQVFPSAQLGPNSNDGISHSYIGAAELVVQPHVAADRQVQAVVPRNTFNRIQHLTFRLNALGAGGAETEVASKDLTDSAQFEEPVRFSNLRANTVYRVRASAYGSGNELISDATQSYVDVSVFINNSPSMANLKVTLVDTPFEGGGAIGLQVTNGQFSRDNRGISTTLAGSSGPRFMDGTKSAARFSGLSGAALDSSGNIYVADTGNNRIRKVTPSGEVSTLAGSGNYGFVDGIGTTASFNEPTGVAVDSAGNVYVADRGNHLIRKVTSAGVVSTLAGNNSYGFADGTGTAAIFASPYGVAVDGPGNVYVADSGNNRIRKVTPAGVVTTLAGSGSNGYADGAGAIARFEYPLGLAVDGSGNIFVADRGNQRIRKVTAAGVVSTLAGNASASFADGTGAAACFNNPIGVTVDSSGNVYVADRDNNRIRKVTLTGVVTTLAGNGATGSNNGTGTGASFNYPNGVSVDGFGNVYVADTSNGCLRKVTPTGAVTTLAGSVSSGYVDGTGTNASFASPQGVALDRSGNVYVADTGNNRIRKVTPAGIVSTLAGNGVAGFADGLANSACFRSPSGVAVDGSGNVFVADTNNHCIRKVTPTGLVSTLAGSGSAGFADGFGNSARFNYPNGVAVDNAGNVYVADTGNNRIRKVTPVGAVTTLAGSGSAGFSDGVGAAANFAFPNGVAVDVSGNIYVADTSNLRIRKVTPVGVVTTLAGSENYGSVDGEGAAASFAGPQSVAVDSAGIVYIADRDNSRIRMVTPAGMVTTLAGNDSTSSGDGIGTAAGYASPSGIAVDSSGTVYVADTNNHQIRRIF